MSNDSSPSPNESPSSGSPPLSGSPPPSGSSSSPPPSSPPPSPPSPPEDNSGNSSPSPPPPSEESPSSSPPPPSPTEGSSPSPPTEGSSPSPPSPKGGNDNGNSNNNNGTVNSPPPPVENRGGHKETPSQDFVPPPASLSPNQSSPPSSDGSSYSGKSSSNSNAGVIIGVVVAGGVLLLLMCVCIMCFRRKKKKGSSTPSYGWEGASNPQGNQYWQKPPQDHVVKIPPTSGGGWGQTPMAGSGEESGQQSGNQVMTSSSFAPSPSLALGFNKSTFSYEELAEATNKFDKSRMLGQGGFGYVYKGVLSNGKEVAVKSLKVGSGQGEREFQAEVDIISRVHHRHLVSLVGYCIAGGQRMLVYEFVPNDTLEYHLHKRGELDFPTRLRIALGSARGLGYLHEDCHPRIIHRDIKASNILLDENYEAMVADFGLAKLTSDTNSHVSTRVMGTFGYLAPEYASSGKLTEKSDVFSFGVMLLEIVTGRRPVDPNMNYMEDSLVDWSRPLLAKALEGANNYHEFVDPRLEGNYDPQLMKRMVACAAASIRHSAKRRPKMSQIVRALEGDVSLDDLNHEGTKPGQGVMLSSSEGSDQYDTRAYSADLKKFRQMAFATQDFASSEYGGTTSEYGINPSTTSSDSSREMHSKKIP